MSSTIHFSIHRLLEFYDESPNDNRHHTTAITSVLGEELGAGLLVDYYHRRGFSVYVSQPCTQGTQKGKRLDRWVKVVQEKRTTYYQVEIKNWAASAIGGRKIAIDANATQLRDHKIERWSRERDGKTFMKEQVRKVLTPMRPPKDAVHIEPMVCYWDAMHPTGKADALFSVLIHSGGFNRVWIFSMSSHLRNLLKAGEEFVEIEATDIRARHELLNKLIS